MCCFDLGESPEIAECNGKLKNISCVVAMQRRMLCSKDPLYACKLLWHRWNTFECLGIISVDAVPLEAFFHSRCSIVCMALILGYLDKIGKLFEMSCSQSWNSTFVATVAHLTNSTLPSIHGRFIDASKLYYIHTSSRSAFVPSPLFPLFIIHCNGFRQKACNAELRPWLHPV